MPDTHCFLRWVLFLRKVTTMNSEVKKIERPTLHGKIKKIPRIDDTLTKAGFCADAKAVGDILRNEQRAVNFSYNSNGNGLNAETIQEALDELNEVKAPSDPPMAVDVEYRTAEKWLGKPVYAKIISIPWAAGTVHTIADFEGKQPHKFFGKVGTWTIPFMFQGRLDGDYSAVVTINKNNTDLKIGMYGGLNISGTLELQLWYIKD